MNTDIEWEKWGKKDPYFGVLTDEKFRSRNLTEEVRKEFFESGRIGIGHAVEVCRTHLDQRFTPKRALDFGCGTGRLLVSLSEIAEQVVGLDVSAPMLEEASKNCKHFSLKNVRLLKSDDNLSLLEGRFDFIHSCIVFQHIPIDRGIRIFARLLNHLEDGGICAIHFTYSKANSRRSRGVPSQRWLIRKTLKKIRRRIKSLIAVSTPSQDPQMQMNPYDLNEILFMIQSQGIDKIYSEFTDHGGMPGVILYFQKPSEGLPKI